MCDAGRVPRRESALCNAFARAIQQASEGPKNKSLSKVANPFRVQSVRKTPAKRFARSFSIRLLLGRLNKAQYKGVEQGLVGHSMERSQVKVKMKDAMVTRIESISRAMEFRVFEETFLALSLSLALSATNLNKCTVPMRTID